MYIDKSRNRTVSGKKIEFGIRFNALATDFIKRFISDGGSLSLREINAIHWMCNMRSAYGLLDKYLAIYPFLGGDGVSAQSISNFKHNLLNENYKLTVPSTAIAAANCTKFGWKATGSGGGTQIAGQYWNTGIVPSTTLAYNNHRFSIYSRTNTRGTASTSAFCDLGVNTVAGNSVATSLMLNYLDYSYHTAHYYGVDYGAAPSNSVGYFASSFNPSFRFYQNGNSQQTAIAGNAPSSTLPTNSIFLGGMRNGSNSTAFWPSNRQYTMFGIGLPLTEQEEKIDFYIQHQFELMLGRHAAIES